VETIQIDVESIQTDVKKQDIRMWTVFVWSGVLQSYRNKNLLSVENNQIFPSFTQTQLHVWAQKRQTSGYQHKISQYSKIQWDPITSRLLQECIVLASFSCKPNRFRKRVKNVVTGKGIQVDIECK